MVSCQEPASTTLLRLIADGFGPHEFGLDSTLPDAAGEIVRSAATQLADRFGATYERLYGDHRQLLDALHTAGYPLPPELRAPAEFALARRFEAEIAKAVDSDEASSFETAQAIAYEARQRGFRLATPSATAIMGRTLLTAVERAIEDPEPPRIGAALHLLRLTRQLAVDARPRPIAGARPRRARRSTAPASRPLTRRRCDLSRPPSAFAHRPVA